MGKRRFLVSLMTDDNDFQIEQASSAQQAAARWGVEIQIVYAENDAITQSTQILRAIHVPEEDHPKAIIFEPVGATALPQVAQASVKAGIGWAVLNRDASYIAELRRTSKVPVFGVSSDIEGPSQNTVAQEREMGLEEITSSKIHVIVLRGQWTEDSGADLAESVVVEEHHHRLGGFAKRCHGDWRAESVPGLVE